MKGFTLVEVMVALFVFALLSAAGVGVLAATADNREAVRSRMDRLAEFQRARALLRADFAQAAVRLTRGLDGEQARSVLVDGDGAMLIGFTRRGWSNPDRDPRGSLQYVEYRLVEDRLERVVRSVPDGGDLRAPQVLLTGVERAEIEFLFRNQWAPDWGGGVTDLPQAVRLTLAMDDLGPVTQAFMVTGASR